MKMGAAGLALLKSFEQCRLTAYQDSGGIWTIGWGHTGPEVHGGLSWDQAHADAALVLDLQVAVVGVMKGLDIALGQNAFDALVCFVYNVGVHAFQGSTLLRLVNAGHDASAEFLRWDRVGGVESAGLLRRRGAERSLFLLPDIPAAAPAQG